MWRQVFCDEQGQISSPRVQSFTCTVLGVLVAVAGLIMVGCGVKDVTPYVGMVLGATFGKGASDIWAAQLKSGKVLAVRETSTTTVTTTPNPSPQPAAQPLATAPPGSATSKTTIATGGAP